MLAFVEGYGFQLFIALAVCLNLIELALMADYPERQDLWSILDNLFLGILLTDLLLRLLHKGSLKSWAIFDFLVVVLGILDLWMLPFIVWIVTVMGGTRGGITIVIRTLRLLRLLRLMRVLRIAPTVMQFVKGLVQMLWTLTSTLVVVFLFLGSCAILLTHILGREANSLNDKQDHEAALRANVREKFASVERSIFSLFQVMTTDDWGDIAFPVIEMNKGWRYFFMAFIVFGAWVMISILTAVASDSMIEATSNRQEIEMQQQRHKYKKFIDFLQFAFKDGDTDGNGLLDREEFMTLIEKDVVCDRMQQLGVQLAKDEFLKAWELLDADGSGELNIDEFVSGLSLLQESLTTKHIANVDYRLRGNAMRVESEIDSLTHELAMLKQQNRKILQLMRERDDHFHHCGALLYHWQEWVSKRQPSALDSRVPRLEPPAEDT